MRAWPLLVVSSEGQREDLDDYVALARADAAKNGWLLERLNDYREVASGKNGIRSPVLKMLADLKAMTSAQRPQWIWCRRTDRFSRGSAAEATMVKITILGLGVGIWDHDRGEVKIGNAQEELLENVAGFYARFDNEVRSSKARTKYAQKRAAGLAVGNKRPYGLVIGPDGKDVPVQDQAEAVRAMFAMRAEGIGFYRISVHMASVAPPIRYKKTGERQMRWTPARVRILLSNPAYIGTVVDEVTFRRVQQVSATMSRTRGTRKNPWPLSGVLRCYCGTAVIGQATGREGRFRYYTCRATWHHDGKFRLTPAVKVEAQFVAWLRAAAADVSLFAAARLAAQSSPGLLTRSLASTRAELAALDRRWNVVWEAAESGAVRIADVQARLDVITAERSAVLERIAHLENELASVHLAQTRFAGDHALVVSASALYSDADDDDQRMIAHAVGLAVGGFCIEEDGRFTVRRPIDPTARRRVAH